MAASFPASVPKNPRTHHLEWKPRCKRLVWLLSPIIGAAVAGGAAAAVAVEDKKVQDKITELWELKKKALLEEAERLRRTTTTVPSTTTVTSTTTPTPGQQQGRQILLNFELEDFNYIPRGLFMFDVQPIPGYENRMDAEYLLLNPDYTAMTNPDRFHNSYKRDEYHSSLHYRQVTNGGFLNEAERLRQKVRPNKQLLKNLHEQVGAANRQLRDLQAARFATRAEEISRGVISNDGKNDSELSRAVFHEVRWVMGLYNLRTEITAEMVSDNPHLECTMLGNELKKHAQRVGAMGVPTTKKEKKKDSEPLAKGSNLPDLYLITTAPGYVTLSSEEIEWLANPTMSWLPRQTGIQANFPVPYEDSLENDRRQYYHDNFVQNAVEPEFQLPTYAEYDAVFPVFGTLPNTGCNVQDELFLDSESDGDSDYDDNNGGPPPAP